VESEVLEMPNQSIMRRGAKQNLNLERRKKTERKLLKAALELFVKNGYHGTTVDAITKRAGVTKGALYNHFPSKGKLLLRINDHFRTAFIEELFRKVKGEKGTAADKLHSIITFNSRFCAENLDLCIFLTFLTAELKESSEFKKAFKANYDLYRKLLGNVIRQGQREGVFRKEMDCDLMTIALMGFLDGVLHQWVLGAGQINGEDYVRTFRRAILAGLK
jgi:TetR/AcrR family fatty acid metabolism transcriptional regulator